MRVNRSAAAAAISRLAGPFGAGVLLVLAAGSGCGAAERGPEPARVRFVVHPERARVYSDERFLGTARVLARRPHEVRPGLRRFTVRAEDYFPHDLEVDLPSGTTTLEIRLRPIPR